MLGWKKDGKEPIVRRPLAAGGVLPFRVWKVLGDGIVPVVVLLFKVRSPVVLYVSIESKESMESDTYVDGAAQLVQSIDDVQGDDGLAIGVLC